MPAVIPSNVNTVVNQGCVPNFPSSHQPMPYPMTTDSPISIPMLPCLRACNSCLLLSGSRRSDEMTKTSKLLKFQIPTGLVTGSGYSARIHSGSRPPRAHCAATRLVESGVLLHIVESDSHTRVAPLVFRFRIIKNNDKVHSTCVM